MSSPHSIGSSPNLPSTPALDIPATSLRSRNPLDDRITPFVTYFYSELEEAYVDPAIISSFQLNEAGRLVICANPHKDAESIYKRIEASWKLTVKEVQNPEIFTPLKQHQYRADAENMAATLNTSTGSFNSSTGSVPFAMKKEHSYGMIFDMEVV